jgi:hypothetical protein
MGMHHGIIAAEVSADRLRDALDVYTGEFSVAGDAATMADLDLGNSDAGFAVAFGEASRHGYAYDGSLILSADPDLLAAVSRELGGTVVGAGAETTSGSYWFVAARRGEPVRFHWNSYWGQDAPYDVGRPLASEGLDPLEDLDGVGLRAAAAELGFDLDAIQHIPLTPYRWTYTREPPEGALGVGLSEFLEAHAYPKTDRMPKPAVIRRRQGYDLAPPESRLPRGETGHKPRRQGRPPGEDGVGQRLGRLFGRR